MKKTVLIFTLAFAISLSFANASNCYEIENNLFSYLEVDETSALCLAVVKGDKEAVENLIAMGESIDEKSNGMMPIHYAARYNRVEILKVLITAGAEVHVTCDKGFTPLKHAEMSKAGDAEQFLKRFKR